MARCRTAVCISNANPLDTSRDRCHGLTVAFATTTLGLTCLSSYQIINELKMNRNYYFVCEQRKDRLRKKCWYLYIGINDAIPIYQTNDSRMWMYLWCHPCQYNKFNDVWIVVRVLSGRGWHLIYLRKSFWVAPVVLRTLYVDRVYRENLGMDWHIFTFRCWFDGAMPFAVRDG